MEVLVLFTARFLAVADPLAGALDREDVSLVAPFTLANKSPSCVLVLVGEAGGLRADLNNHDDLVEFVIADGQR